jgi:SAM-dependent methyltransferase
MACPLCDHPRARRSWIGSTFYKGQEFPYVECLACRSLYCEPMPDEKTLSLMYGPEYAELFHGHENMGGAADAAQVLDWLKRTGQGTFIDYGCGAGALLHEAKRAGWNAVGVEFDGQVAAEVSKRTGARVASNPAELLEAPADVLHLGDVIEHLTDANRQMPEILRLLKPGGLLLAQGPLENHTNVFNSVVRLARTLRPRRRTEMAPYHVVLTTAQGQKAFFRRFGLEELAYSIREDDWPATSSISFSDLSQPRLVCLFLLRRFSKSVSTLLPVEWGNRYFFAGRWAGTG